MVGENLYSVIKILFFSPSLVEKTKLAGVARWFTGCYINEEDACFDKKINSYFYENDDMATGPEEKVRAFPEPMPPKKKNIKMRTNAASKLLGLSVLLDPMLHDKIDSNNDENLYFNFQ